MNRQTYQAKPSEVTRDWVHVDATDQVLGRLATRIATVLMGKHKPTYTPHQDVGDFVVVTNAKRLTLTGKKLDQKIYERFTGYPNGLKQYTYRRIMERRPEQIIEKAVWRMMPRGPLARQQFKKLKVYAGPDHPHAAQQPTELDLSKV